MGGQLLARRNDTELWPRYKLPEDEIFCHVDQVAAVVGKRAKAERNLKRGRKLIVVRARPILCFLCFAFTDSCPVGAGEH